MSWVRPSITLTTGRRKIREHIMEIANGERREKNSASAKVQGSESSSAAVFSFLPWVLAEGWLLSPTSMGPSGLLCAQRCIPSNGIENQCISKSAWAAVQSVLEMWPSAALSVTDTWNDRLYIVLWRLEGPQTSGFVEMRFLFFHICE